MRTIAPALSLMVVALSGSPSLPLSGVQPLPGAKAMFYDPGDLGLLPAEQPAGRLRPVRYVDRAVHCGIHYWLQSADGTKMTERTARAATGPFTLHLRNSIGNGFLTVWNVSTGRRTDAAGPGPAGQRRWSVAGVPDVRRRV